MEMKGVAQQATGLKPLLTSGEAGDGQSGAEGSDPDKPPGKVRALRASNGVCKVMG